MIRRLATGTLGLLLGGSFYLAERRLHLVGASLFGGGRLVALR